MWAFIRDARYVCFADDDVQRAGGTWAEAFDLLEWVETVHGVDVAQCALTRDSYYSHPVTLVDPESEYRTTNFVEMMAPILRAEKALEWREAFRDVGPVAWGVEALWSGKRAPCAILDATPMRHLRPLRTWEHVVRMADGVDPYDDRDLFMARWKLSLPVEFRTRERFKTGNPRYRVGVSSASH